MTISREQRISDLYKKFNKGLNTSVLIKNIDETLVFESIFIKGAMPDTPHDLTITGAKVIDDVLFAPVREVGKTDKLIEETKVNSVAQRQLSLLDDHMHFIMQQRSDLFKLTKAIIAMESLVPLTREDLIDLNKKISDKANLIIKSMVDTVETEIAQSNDSNRKEIDDILSNLNY